MKLYTVGKEALHLDWNSIHGPSFLFIFSFFRGGGKEKNQSLFIIELEDMTKIDSHRKIPNEINTM